MSGLVKTFRGKAANAVNWMASAQEKALDLVKGGEGIPFLATLRQPLSVSLKATSSGLRSCALGLAGDFKGAAHNVHKGLREVLPEASGMAAASAIKPATPELSAD